MPLDTLSQPKRCSFTEILKGIKALLVSELVLPVTAVKIIGRRPEDVPKFTGNKDILIRPSRFDTWEILEESAGRVDFEVYRKVIVVPRLRMLLDTVDKDELWDFAMFDFEESIVNVLLEFMPTDASGNGLLCNGLKCVSGDQLERDMPGNDKDPMWGDSLLMFKAQYMPPLTGDIIGRGL